MAVLGLSVIPSLACASDYCTKEQYERDRAFVESAVTAGTLAKGPKGLRDSMLVHEGFWFDMNYPEQIAFMQRFECAAAGTSGKHLLYMDVGRLPPEGYWRLGRLGCSSQPRDPTTRPSQKCQKVLMRTTLA